MGKGKGRRRRQANYLASHGAFAELPAPPATSDEAALPAKLRRIIALNSASAQGSWNVGIAKDAHIGRRQTNQSTLQKKKCGKAGDASSGSKEEPLVDARDGCPSEATRPKDGKRRKWQEELHALSERFKATPLRKGLHERRKRYLREKKNKKRRQMASDTSECNPSLHKQERIRFGDIVQAPPSLNLPRKHKTAAEERLRQQAITLYREKKKWSSRPGSHQPPPLADVATINS